MIDVIIEFYKKQNGKFAGIMRTALPYYFYHGDDIIGDISTSALRKIIPSLPKDVHFVIRTEE